VCLCLCVCGGGGLVRCVVWWSRICFVVPVVKIEGTRFTLLELAPCIPEREKCNQLFSQKTRRARTSSPNESPPQHKRRKTRETNSETSAPDTDQGSIFTFVGDVCWRTAGNSWFARHRRSPCQAASYRRRRKTKRTGWAAHSIRKQCPISLIIGSWCSAYSWHRFRFMDCYW